MVESDTSNANNVSDTKTGVLAAGFARAAAACGLKPSDAQVIVGVSGGLDSMVLLDLLINSGFLVHVAHVNYRLRGSESDGDERLVSEICQKYGCECSCHRVDLREIAQRKKRSIQELARDVRYAYFAELADSIAAELVAVAHHRGDQIETILLNLFRGAGARGLSGLPAERSLQRGLSVRLVRPLLEFDRGELLDYARKSGLVWREDQSNTSRRYKRSVIRHEVVPLIKKHFGGRALQGILDLQAEMDSLQTIERYLSTIGLHRVQNGFDIDLQVLETLPEKQRGRLVLDAIQQISHTAPVGKMVARQILDLADSQPGRRKVFDTIVVWRGRRNLHFRSLESGSNLPEPVTVQIPGILKIGNRRLRTRLVEHMPPLDHIGRNEIYADAEHLAGTLICRIWKRGEVMTPYGMKGTKRVSDILTDGKYPVFDRNSALVLEADGQILWVLGVSRSNLAPVSKSTKTIVHFQCW